MILGDFFRNKLWGEQAFCSETSLKQGKNKVLGNKFFLETGFLGEKTKLLLETSFWGKKLLQKQAFGEQPSKKAS